MFGSFHTPIRNAGNDLAQAGGPIESGQNLFSSAGGAVDGLLVYRVFEEGFKVRLKLHARRLMDVEHVAGLIVRKS